LKVGDFLSAPWNQRLTYASQKPDRIDKSSRFVNSAPNRATEIREERFAKSRYKIPAKICQISVISVLFFRQHPDDAPLPPWKIKKPVGFGQGAVA
jgi:hypothetical protein